MWLKFFSWLKKLDNAGLLAFSFLLALNSLFFIALVVEQVGFWAILSLGKVYAVYFGLFLLYALLWAYILRKKTNFEYFLRRTFYSLAPAVVVLLYGFSESIKFNILFKLGVGAYFIVLGLYLIFKAKEYKKLSDFWKSFPEEKASEKKNKYIWAVLFLVFIINLGFGFYHLDRFAAVDEALWTNGRITKYWNNISEGEWEKTGISDKPGITVALLTGLGLFWVDPGDYDRKNDYGRSFDPPKDVRDMNLVFRFPILLVGALSLFLFFIFLRFLLGMRAALLAVVFIGLSPLLLGMSTIINPDSLLWIAVPLALLAFLNYQKSRSDRWLYLAGIMLGLSILTKYVANILYVFFFGMIFLEYIFHSEKYKSLGVGKYLKKALIDYFVIIFFSLAVFYLFLPKAWVEIDALLFGTIFSQAFQKIWPIFLGIILLIILDISFFKSRTSAFVLDRLARLKRGFLIFFLTVFSFLALLTFLNTILGMPWFDLESILASPKSAYMTSGILGMMLANFYSLIFGISPWALLGLALFIFLAFKDSRNPGRHFPGLIFLIFILIYYLASSVNNVSATVRYQIILYPLAFILGALGIGDLLEIIRIKLEKNRLFWIVSGALLIFGAYSLNFIRPFYFSYANSLLSEKYVLNLKDMGDGSYEAAEYLNSLPDPENIQIWTDKRGVCMFFLGKCRSGIGFENEEAKNFDYFVVSSGRESRTTTMTLNRFNGGNDKILRLDQLYLEENPDWKLEIGNRPNNFVKIIKNTKK